ncbi:hypothetical protein BaRGS_00017233 [Batillaria attramentaria]|uniref:Uncharacterized protein n=1 Tax=Batillaria attramentaria TaxID=370345 RepID=A0ABD0KWI6_9CAEN
MTPDVRALKDSFLVLELKTCCKSNLRDRQHNVPKPEVLVPNQNFDCDCTELFRCFIRRLHIDILLTSLRSSSMLFIGKLQNTRLQKLKLELQTIANSSKLLPTPHPTPHPPCHHIPPAPSHAVKPVKLLFYTLLVQLPVLS